MAGLVVLDFGAGNVASMLKALRKDGGAPVVVEKPEAVRDAERVVVPGVGHFGAAMRELRSRGVDAAIRDAVARGVPLLGVCIGLQVLFQGSAEAPEEAGLGLLEGRCERLRESSRDDGAAPVARRKVPQIGWNEVRPRAGSRLFRGISPASFYFVHSYYAVPADASVVAATAEYGVDYCCAVERGRLAAVQFHPEKSGPVGLRVLENFLAL